MGTNLYNYFIFDCDGVILNSNKIKSLAFYDTVKEFGAEFATKLYEYHLSNGGISRYEKFKYFKEKIYPNGENVDISKLLANFSEIIRNQLINSEVVDGLEELRKNLSSSEWSIVSGGDQIELREVFKQINISNFFDGGIFGSPDTKYDIIQKGIDSGKYYGNVLYFGDSKLDFEVAQFFGFDFVFIYQWTEVVDWEKYCVINKIKYAKDLMSILNIEN
jgi:phosphoglycolate phosphatase-like HAD superfamily hydrolase